MRAMLLHGMSDDGYTDLCCNRRDASVILRRMGAWTFLLLEYMQSYTRSLCLRFWCCLSVSQPLSVSLMHTFSLSLCVSVSVSFSLTVLPLAC